MKKILLPSIFLSVFSLFVLPVFSTEFDTDLLAKPHRIFEIGVDAQAAAANSYFNLNNIFQKDIVIDLTKITNDMPRSGFSVGFYDKEQVFINLNISSRFRFSVFTDVEASGRFSISKDLFELLSSGLNVGSTKTVDVIGYADMFADIGASFQTIVNNYGIRITPTYFIPLLYVPKTKATGTLVTNKEGLIKATAEANVDIYTAIDMQGFVEDGSNLFDDFDYKKILSNGGFDLSLDIDRNWFHNFNAGIYTRIPIIAGTLNYKMSTRMWASFYTENLLDDILTSDIPSPESGYGYEDETTGDKKKFKYSEDTYKAYRPLKLGLSASYAPFGNWLKIQPAFGLAIRNPYSGDMIVYPEYSLDVRLALLKRVFNFNLGTAYQNQIFQQRFGFSLNLRAIEILAQVSMCGTSFRASFERDGYGAMLGYRIGF